MSAAPYTWEAMRALVGEPTCPLDACEICKHLPERCDEDERPAEVKRLVRAGLPEVDADWGSRAFYGCPICHRLYRRDYTAVEHHSYYSSPASTEYTRYTAREVFHELTRDQVTDERFGNALAALEPGLAVEQRTLRVCEAGWYPHHRILQIECGEHRRWVVFSDAGELLPCTLATLSQIAASAPPAGLDQPARAIDYADFVEKVALGERRIVEAFDAIPWRAELADEDRAYIEDLRAASRVEPPQVEARGDRIVIRRWVVDQKRLVCRVLAVSSIGEVTCEDAVIGEAIPVRS